MKSHSNRIRRTMAIAGLALLAYLPAVGYAQTRMVLRVSTPAVPDDWHAKMWKVFKDELERTAPGQFEVQINLNASLFKQGAEPVAMARGNLELAAISAFDIAKVVPEFSVFTAGYVVRDPQHLMKVFGGPIGNDMFKRVNQKMDVTVLSPLYLGTRQLNLRETKNVHTPADLKGIKLRMPASKEWLFLGETLGATPTPLAFGEVYLGLKTGTIDGQENPLPTVRSAKFYEVTRQITLTGHLVDSLFIVVSNRLWNTLKSDQQDRLMKAANVAAVYNNQNRIVDEKALIDFFKSQKLVVTTPDVDAFRKSVQSSYQNSAYAKVWPPGILAQINAVR